MLSVRGVTKHYGDTAALAGVDLDVADGQVMALLGPNGAGKTTLISIIAGLRRPDAGSVLFDGRDLTERPETIHEYIGIAPQETGAYEALTVDENLRFFADLYGRGPAAIGDAVEALALGELTDRLVQELSGGEKRRLHTALAVLSGAPILLLDEPTVGADVRTRASLLAAVRELAAEGTAIVYSTHYFPEVHELGADVTIVDRGRVIAGGSPAELITTHARAAVELTFADAVPADLAARPGVDVDGPVARVPADHPAAALAELLAALGPGVDALTAVDLARPDLDQVFVALTGRRYDPTGGEDAGVDR